MASAIFPSRLAVEQTHQVFEYLGFKDAVVLAQYSGERFELGLDGGHGLGDQAWTDQRR
jgi:hypothetical protein